MNKSPASRPGRDKRGRRGSAALPPYELSRENMCDNIWQNIATCVTKSDKMGQHMPLTTKYDKM